MCQDCFEGKFFESGNWDLQVNKVAGCQKLNCYQEIFDYSLNRIVNPRHIQEVGILPEFPRSVLILGCNFNTSGEYKHY